MPRNEENALPLKARFRTFAVARKKLPREAADRATAPARIEALAGHVQADVRAAAASNPGLPKAATTALLTDTEKVRIGLASNPSLSLASAKVLAADPAELVRNALASATNHLSVLERLVHD